MHKLLLLLCSYVLALFYYQKWRGIERGFFVSSSYGIVCLSLQVCPIRTSTKSSKLSCALFWRVLYVLQEDLQVVGVDCAVVVDVAEQKIIRCFYTGQPVVEQNDNVRIVCDAV